MGSNLNSHQAVSQSNGVIYESTTFSRICHTDSLINQLRPDSCGTPCRTDPEDATHVISGTVRCVFTRETATQMQYMVEIRVSAVQRPESVTPGDIVHFYCFQRKKDKPAAESNWNQIVAAQLETIGEKGHTSVPTEGQRVRVLANFRNGRLEGN